MLISLHSLIVFCSVASTLRKQPPLPLTLRQSARESKLHQYGASKGGFDQWCNVRVDFTEARPCTEEFRRCGWASVALS